MFVFMRKFQNTMPTVLYVTTSNLFRFQIDIYMKLFEIESHATTSSDESAITECFENT